IHKVPPDREHVALVRYVLHGGFRRMLQQVDIPAAVTKRDDLMIWLTCGDHDWFPKEDQESILTASRSSPNLKKLFVLPDSGHAQDWKDSQANDARIKAFLKMCASR